MNTRLHASRLDRSPLPAAAGGFTLIEMMISITIGLGILAGLVGVLASNASNSRSNERTSELMTNGRYALNSIKQELRQAGFRGFTWAEPIARDASVTATALAGECLQAGAAAGAFVSNLRQGVWGSNDDNPFATTCIPAANYAALTDVLVLRRVAAVPAAALAADMLYFRSTYNTGQVFRGVTPPPFPGAPAPLASFALQTYVYYISPFTVSAAESPLVPALWRVALQTDGSMQRELVASGIERLQVQYGTLSTAPATQYVDTFATGTSFDATSNITWDSVNSVRIWLLARSAAPEPGYSNTNQYVMGSQTFTAADSFRRQLFSTVVQLRN